MQNCGTSVRFCINKLIQKNGGTFTLTKNIYCPIFALAGCQSLVLLCKKIEKTLILK